MTKKPFQNVTTPFEDASAREVEYPLHRVIQVLKGLETGFTLLPAARSAARDTVANRGLLECRAEPSVGYVTVGSR